MSEAVSPRTVNLRVDELYDPVKGDWSQVLRSPAIQECELTGMPPDLKRAVCREKELLGDEKPGQNRLDDMAGIVSGRFERTETGATSLPVPADVCDILSSGSVQSKIAAS